MDGYVGEVLLILGLLVLNGFFAAAEIALVSARRTSLKADAERGSTGARVAVQLTENPSRFLSATQVGITLISLTASAAAALRFSEALAAWLRGVGLGARVAGWLGVFLVTLVVSYVTLVIGELAPKRLGLQKAERVAKAVAQPIAVFAAFTAPIIWVLAKSTDVVGLLLGIKPGAGRPGVTEEEIKLLVTEQGTLLDEEKRMIHEVFELGDTVAREIMVPRVDAVMLEDTGTLEEALEIFDRSGFSRMPIFHEDPDRVVGVLLLKDLVQPAVACRIAGQPVTDYMRAPTFVPETKRILELLSEMQKLRSHMAVVVDEYGGTAGIVTVEDIVEEVVGEIADEFDREHQYITELGDGEWIVEGRLSVEEARERLGVPVPESDEYETMAGWLLMELGRIPSQGETIETDGFEYRVQGVRRRRISRLRIRRSNAGEER